MAKGLWFNKCLTVLLMLDSWMLEIIVVPEKPREETKANIKACLFLPGRIAVIIKWYSNYSDLRD